MATVNEWMSLRRVMQWTGSLGVSLSSWLLAASLSVGNAQAGSDVPERVRDLNYGTVLYEYYQGHAFEALTRLGMANAKGGIQGHGDDPLLVEGGLMLAYGMTREAKALFEQVLRDNVSSEQRNQAWFYLGKVFYLEGDHSAAQNALAQVEAPLLAKHKQELYHEWLYLQGQLTLQANGSEFDGWLAKLPKTSLWRSYLVYNRAAHWVAQQQQQPAIDALQGLTVTLKGRGGDAEVATEAAALRERVLLTLGQLHLQQGSYASARESLEKITLDSVFSDQALFYYAVAASQNDEYGIALQALNTLTGRPLFTPWLQQVPYARGFVLEQLGEQSQALQAYRDAATHYQALMQRLAETSDDLSEATIVETLQFNSLTTDAPARTSNRLALQELDILNDPYGRLQVQPQDFSLAELLSSEEFQLGLRDLHELYRLQRSLVRWQQQLNWFDVMLDTRLAQRSQRIAETLAALDALQADQWVQRQAAYNQAIEQGLAEEDPAFFMSDEQKAFRADIDRVVNNLATLPNDETTARQRQKIQRIEAYFDWWVADQYAVNRWAAQSQLRELNQAMTTFSQQTDALQQEIATDDQHQVFSARIQQNQARLEILRAELEQALSNARDLLVAQVQAELARQQREVQQYLKAARYAQARLSDALFQTGEAL